MGRHAPTDHGRLGDLGTGRRDALGFRLVAADTPDLDADALVADQIAQFRRRLAIAEAAVGR